MNQAASVDADRQQILAQLQAFASLTGGREDNARYLQEFTDDMTLLPPDGPALCGRRAVQAYYDTLLQSVASARVTYNDPVIDVDGALAVRRYTATAVIVRKGSDERRVMRTKYLDVLNKGADGTWKIAVHMWSTNESATEVPHANA
jgi:ketosteroid isomerase-like protein